MDSESFGKALSNQSSVIAQIRALAHNVHDEVNQKYDKVHPYWFHLDMVADNVMKYGHAVCQSDKDVAPLVFGAYFHDAIEDARLTYRDVYRMAQDFFDEEHAIMATEIAYALTNEKGRTRAERANDKYYEGIRATPYAPLVKLADRLANASYSANTNCTTKCYMHKVYADENPHFLESITVADSADPRLSLPCDMVDSLKSLFNTQK